MEYTNEFASFCYQHNLHSSQTVLSITLRKMQFCYQHNLHSSQTSCLIHIMLQKFCYQHNLHSSQTVSTHYYSISVFCYQHNLHSSQTRTLLVELHRGFATSIIYIVLKPQMLSTCKYPT